MRCTAPHTAMITLMSFNTQHCLNFVTRQIDFDIMADAIRACGADIAGLQEIRDIGENLAEYRAQAGILAGKLGFHCYFGEAIMFNGGNPYGNALLSRFPIESAETFKIKDPEPRGYSGYYETRCVIKAVIALPEGKKLTVCVSHFGLNPDEQENAVAKCMEIGEDRNFVLMGDFNMVPEDPILRPLAGRYYDTSKKARGSVLSFPSDKPDRKIDYIFTSKDIGVIEAGVPAIVASDHRPHTAVIDL